MDFEVLEQIVSELAELLPGSRVDKVIQSVDDSLVLALHRPKKDHYLLLAPERSLPRIHLLSRKPQGKAAPYGFFLSLRKHLTGSRLDRLRLVQDDRIVELRFMRPGSSHLLFFELTGSVTNIVLTDDDHRIIALLNPVAPDTGSARPLLPGAIYSPPELRHRRMRPKDRDALAVNSAEYRGNAPVNVAVEAWFMRRLEELATTALRRELAAVIKKAAGRVERRREAVAQDVNRAEQGDDLRTFGELILANKHRLRKGLATIDLSGYDGSQVRVVLDPSRTPQENANRYFQRYKKAQSGLALLRERLAHAQDEAAFLYDLERELGAAEDREGLLAVRAKLVKRGYARDGKGLAPTAVQTAAQPYRTIEHDGWQILVGKSSAGNDYITMKLARPDDLWLHAEGMPGSHVVVRNPEKRDIPGGVLRKAASLAAYYSKGRGSTKVPVAYTKASMVKKPKGAAPGTVVLAARKTVMAVPESSQDRP